MAETLYNAGTKQVRPVVAALIWRAEQFASTGDIGHADSFFRAAMAADLTPNSRMAYGIFLADTEREADSLVELLAACETAKLLGDLPSLALICHNLATLHRRLGQTTLAFQFQQRALSAWLAQPEASDLPEWLLLGWAETALMTGETQAAEFLLQRPNTDAEGQVATLANLAVAAWIQGDEQRGLSLATRAFELALEHPGTENEGRLVENVAHMLRLRGKFRDAARCFEIAAKLHRRAGHPKARWRANRHKTTIQNALSQLQADPQRN